MHAEQVQPTSVGLEMPRRGADAAEGALRGESMGRPNRPLGSRIQPIRPRSSSAKSSAADRELEVCRMGGDSSVWRARRMPGVINPNKARNDPVLSALSVKSLAKIKVSRIGHPIVIAMAGPNASVDGHDIRKGIILSENINKSGNE